MSSALPTIGHLSTKTRGMKFGPVVTFVAETPVVTGDPRITEAGETRLTEAGETRVVE